MLTIDTSLDDNLVEHIMDATTHVNVRRAACETLVERGLHGTLTDAGVAWVYETTRNPATRKVAASTLNSRGLAALNLIGMNPILLADLVAIGR